MRIQIECSPRSSATISGLEEGMIFSFTDRANSTSYLDGIHSDEQPFYMVANLPKRVKKYKDDVFAVALDGRGCIMARGNRSVEVHSGKEGFCFEFGELAKKRTQLSDLQPGQVFHRLNYYTRFDGFNGVLDVPAGRIPALNIEKGLIELFDSDLGVFVCPSARIVQMVVF